MRTLNDIPEAWLEDDRDTWTPGKGLIRGTLYATVVAAIISAVHCLIARYCPIATTHLLFNVVWGFVTCWVLFAVMHNTAGLTGQLCTFIVVVLSSVVIISKHLVFAAHDGWHWMQPSVIVLANIPAAVAITGCSLMCKDGDSILNDVAEALMRNAITGQRWL